MIIYRKKVRKAWFRRKMTSLTIDKDSFYDILNHSKDILYKFDIASLRYTYISPSVENILGYPPQEIINGGFAFVNSLLHPEDRQKQMNVFETLLDGKRINSEIPMEYRIIHKDGSIVFLSDHVNIMKTRDKTGYVIGNVRDITIEKTTKCELILSEKRFKELYQHATIGLFTTKITDGKLIDCNNIFATQLEYDSIKGCIENFEFAQPHLSTEFRDSFITKLKENGEIHSIDTEVKLHNNNSKWFRFSAIMNEGLECIEFSAIDITCSKILTPAEKRVLKLILAGMSNSEIANHINRSRRTIEDQRAHIMKKLDASNQVELTIKAIDQGFPRP